MSLFATKSTLADPAVPIAPAEAYREGRRDGHDEHLQDARSTQVALDNAYERGRRDERLRRRQSPLTAIALFLLALVAIIVLVMDAVYGSFTAAGAAIDSAINSVRPTPPA